jgi:hypothetical protein
MPETVRVITGATDAVPVPSTGSATEVGPLTSSPPGRGQSSGAALIPGELKLLDVFSTVESRLSYDWKVKAPGVFITRELFWTLWSHLTNFLEHAITFQGYHS